MNPSQSKQKPISLKNRNALLGLFFIAPSLIGVSVFVLIPFVDAVRRSFFEAVGGRFVGFANFQKVMGNDAFRLAVSNTIRFLLICIPVLLVSSLLLALMVQASTKRMGKELFKTTFLLPMAIPAASAVLLWRMLFADKGLINGMMQTLGVQSVSFMNSGLAFWVLVISYLWKNAGYDMVLWLAGLSGISPALYEAARVDGAGRAQCFRFITLPCLMPTMFTVSVLSLLNSFKVFREAYLVAGSHPHDSMYLLQHLFNNWFATLDIQKMCAAAVLMAAVIVLLVLFLQKAWGGAESDD